MTELDLDEWIGEDTPIYSLEIYRLMIDKLMRRVNEMPDDDRSELFRISLEYDHCELKFACESEKQRLTNRLNAIAIDLEMPSLEDLKFRISLKENLPIYINELVHRWIQRDARKL